MQARFDTSGPLTSTLRLTGSDGWFVDRVDLYVGSVDFKCPVSGWLDNGRRAAGPGSRRLTCTSTGEIITLSYNTTLIPRKGSVRLRRHWRTVRKLGLTGHLRRPWRIVRKLGLQGHFKRHWRNCHNDWN